ncbi:hypothetical protein SAMN05421779_105173 [Insolitispirillum peregrinum]|uniref:Uncharacterized protein n=1 Tax=Insolitispirillum peregrinum TaxID=80876 RepID=A0A1N7NJQ2_9PROT|nr:hypothetical protein SAMN05421779_105173 [Insolitispirillum peregrinum]
MKTGAEVRALNCCIHILDFPVGEQAISYTYFYYGNAGAG